MDSNKKYSPYHGCWVIFLMLICIPLAFYFIISVLINHYQPHFAQVNPASARCLGCLLGSIFHLSCLIGGLLRDPWRAFCYRVKEFFANLSCGLSFALSCYWEDMKTDGALLLPYLAIIGVCLYFAIEGGITALSLLK